MGSARACGGPRYGGARASCVSQFTFAATEWVESPTLARFETVGVVVVSAAPAPGATAGTQATSIVVQFAYGDSTKAEATAFSATCSADDRSACAAAGDLGLTIDVAARTIRFDQVRLMGTADPSKVVVLDGTLSY